LFISLGVGISPFGRNDSIRRNDSIHRNDNNDRNEVTAIVTQSPRWE